MSPRGESVNWSVRGGWDPLPRRIAWLKPAIRGWIKANTKYANSFDDSLYWYNERASISALAAGAWTGGLFAIEEYTAFKTSAAVSRKRPGRADLYIGHEDNRRHEATFEAKICWMRHGVELATLKKHLRSACSDARRYDEAEDRFGVVFFVVKMRSGSVSSAAIRDRIDRVRAIDPDVVAWCFPASSRDLSSKDRDGNIFIWPGVIMAMKAVKRYRRD